MTSFPRSLPQPPYLSTSLRGCRKELCVEGWVPFTPQIFTDCVPSAGPGAKALGSGPGCVHYSCLTQASRPWTQGGGGGRRQGPGSPCVGDGRRRTVAAACLRSLPQPTRLAGVWLYPNGSSLLTQERWGSWGQGGGLPGSQAGGGSHHSCPPAPGSDNPAPQELDSPRARLGKTSCSLPHILGGKLSLEAEPTGKNNQGA